MNIKTFTAFLLLFSSLASTTVVNAAPRSRRFTFDFNPPTRGVPKYTIAGAVRGNLCARDRIQEEDLMAYVAASAKTSVSHPTIVATIPKLNGDKVARLIIKDAAEDYYEEQILNIPAEGGELAFSLDSSKPALEVGKDYQFFLRIQCQEKAMPEDPFVSGYISRVEPIAISESASLEEKVAVYANSGVWYDALASALQLRENGNSEFFEQLVKSTSLSNE